jgi:hypothetical protein
MDDEEESYPPLRPMDEGWVPQAIVEYTGERLGAVTYRGPSGTEYRFGAGPQDRRKYVLLQDLDHFRQRPDFRVIEGSLRDPEAEKTKAIEEPYAEMLDQRDRRLVGTVAKLLDDWGRAKQHRSPGTGGRLGKGVGALLDCWMTCGRLEDYYGTPREAYEAIHRYLKEHAGPGGHVPPRERLASMRSAAKRARETAGLECLWHNHPEPVPPQLCPTDDP